MLRAPAASAFWSKGGPIARGLPGVGSTPVQAAAHPLPTGRRRDTVAVLPEAGRTARSTGTAGLPCRVDRAPWVGRTKSVCRGYSATTPVISFGFSSKVPVAFFFPESSSTA